MTSDAQFPKTTNALHDLDGAIYDIETGIGLLTAISSTLLHGDHPGITIEHLDYLAEQVQRQVSEVRRQNDEVWRAWRQERDPEKFALLVQAGIYTPCGDVVPGKERPAA